MAPSVGRFCTPIQPRYQKRHQFLVLKIQFHQTKLKNYQFGGLSHTVTEAATSMLLKSVFYARVIYLWKMWFNCTKETIKRVCLSWFVVKHSCLICVYVCLFTCEWSLHFAGQCIVYRLIILHTKQGMQCTTRSMYKQSLSRHMNEILIIGCLIKHLLVFTVLTTHYAQQ